jgi:putative ABC transport system permease protein
VAVAALMIAVSVTIGVSLMVTSFRSTVVTWLDQILQGDIYISAPGASVGQPSYPLEPEVIPILETWQGVERVVLLQTATVDSPHGPIQISASDNPNQGIEQIYRSTTVPPSEITHELARGAVLISEPLANRLDLSADGDELRLYTDRGLISFPVAGVYYDYSSTQGRAILSRQVYRDNWEDGEISAASLVLEPGVDLEKTNRELQERLGTVQQLQIRPNQALRRETLVIFDRTFAITSTLQIMTTVVAFVGVLSAMLSLQLEKRRQIGILRAVGLTGSQLWRLVLLETGLMGLVAGVLAMPTGYVLSLILIYIINRRSFGWTLLMKVSPGPFLTALGIAVAASTLAGIYPARKMIRESISEVIRFE